MKIKRILSVCVAIAIPHLAVANLPFANDEFGKVETTLSFCAKLNPESAAKYREIGKRYVGNAPEKELADARKTPEYKEAYESNAALLADMAPERVVEACNAILKAKAIR